MRIALKNSNEKSEENVKGALTLQINWSCAKTLKPVSDFALFKQNLLASVGIFKANKVQSPTPSDFINFEDCF